MRIPRDVLDRIRAHAEEAYPEESCGFLVGEAGETEGVTVRVRDEIPARNVAPVSDRTRTFTVDPKVLLDTMRTFRDREDDVVGFYHSHPDHPAALSPTDLKFAANWPRTVWLIVPVEGREEATGPRAGVERAWWLPSRRATGDSRGDSRASGTTASIEGEIEMKIDEMKIDEMKIEVIRDTTSADFGETHTPRGETA